MKTTSIESGYWVATDSMIKKYDTIDEAESHIKFQREHMGSKATWHIIHIKAEWIKTDKYIEK